MTIDREAILDEWWFPIPLDQMPDYDRGQLLDLISRAVDAAYEDAAKAVEGEHQCGLRACSDERCRKARVIAAAIRALIGGGE